MHLVAVVMLLTRYHKNEGFQDLLGKLDKDKLVGSMGLSDPATGGHVWSSLSSKVKVLDKETLKILKYCSWVTSAGHADWYIIQVTSPDFKGDVSDSSYILIYKDEARSSEDDWSSLGLRGNQSGPLVVEGKIPRDRLVGCFGDAFTVRN
ncbi:UNVERIFIED_CONTAM: hypothetical protein GTU68_010716 [Idotea baltica]|nr:hypothetical protein [Idotea baltica]